MTSAISAWIGSRIDRLSRPLLLQWPGGRAGAADAPVRLKVHDAEHLQWLASGQIGTLADAYVQGEIEIEGDIQAAIAIAVELAEDPAARAVPKVPEQLLNHLRSRWLHRANTDLDPDPDPDPDPEMVQQHGDLGEEFFALWLDPRRMYSCAYFEQPELTLAQAQEAELEHICRRLQLAPGHMLLDVGAGWGGLLL